MSEKSPSTLWLEAERERDLLDQSVEWRRQRYHELMVEHELIVPGKPEPLDCGWFPGAASNA